MKGKRRNEERKSENSEAIPIDTNTHDEVSSFSYFKCNQKLQEGKKFPTLNSRQNMRSEIIFEVLSNSEIPQVINSSFYR